MYNPIDDIIKNPRDIIEILIDNNLKDVIFSIRINKKPKLVFVAILLQEFIDTSKEPYMQLSMKKYETEWVARALLFLQSELDIQIKIHEEEEKK